MKRILTHLAAFIAGIIALPLEGIDKDIKAVEKGSLEMLAGV